jgi:hypothetical protein
VGVHVVSRAVGVVSRAVGVVSRAVGQQSRERAVGVASRWWVQSGGCGEQSGSGAEPPQSQGGAKRR